jgi:uncharacterized protein YqgV (UPF0045/DUF77 family)
MTLMEFSMIPLEKNASFSPYFTKLLAWIDESRLEYRLNPMGAVVE